MRAFFILAIVAAAALVSATGGIAGQPVTQTLNPPPPPWQTCKAVGSGTICEGTNTDAYGPVDTGIACGSGAGAFDIFDAAVDEYRIRKFFDENGNLVRRWFHDHYTCGQLSNPLTGATLFRNVGRTVQAPDGRTLFRAGPLGFWTLFDDGDASVLDPVCAALGAAS